LLSNSCYGIIKRVKFIIDKGLNVKISVLLETPSVKILLFLHERGEVRYTDLTKLIASRGTLSLNIKELEEEGLVRRRILTTKPIQAHYSLTEKGAEIASMLGKIKKIV
jgi:DNA-binding HxlR family transcriptional regulator